MMPSMLPGKLSPNESSSLTGLASSASCGQKARQDKHVWHCKGSQHSEQGTGASVLLEEEEQATTQGEQRCAQ